MINKHAKKKLKLLLILPIALFSPLMFLLIPQKIEAVETDWPMFRKDPEHSGFNNEEGILKPPLKLKWKFGRPGSMGTPVVVGDTLFVRSDLFYALDANNGTIKWSRPYKATSHTSPAVAGDTIYLGSGVHPTCFGCGIEAIDKSTGQLKWFLEFSPKGVRDPNIFNGFLYFGSDDWKMRSVNAVSGILVWETPNLNDGIVGVPAVGYGKVFIGTWGGSFYSLDASNGNVLWQFPTGGVIFSSPSIYNHNVYVGSGVGSVFAFDVNSGALRWRFTQATDSVWGSPAVAYNTVYIQDLAGKVFALDAENGSLIWAFQTNAKPSSSYSSPAVANGVVYIGSQDGSIYALNAFDGILLWQYNTDRPIKSSPVVTNGMLYVGSDDGYLYAFSNEGTTPTPTPTPTPLPFLPVSLLKQYSEPWGDDVYNHATRWAENPYIANWGCALTSAAMVLQYWGHSTDPGSLNQWLTEQPDGYLRNGLVNWLAISRYTREQNEINPDYPILEYRRLTGDGEILSEELSAERPAILKEPGHFVVAKGIMPDTFAINDPAYDIETLEGYGNTYLALGRYKPTLTDLSAILLVVDADVDIQVTNELGNPVGEIFLEEPLNGDVSGETSGETLKVFYLPAPEDGVYSVILGTGEPDAFTLDAYLYDQDGNVYVGHYQGLTQEGAPDEINIEYPTTGKIIQPVVTIGSTLADLEIINSLGWVRNEGIYQSLKSKLVSAQRAAGNSSRNKILTAFLNELLALRDKQIINDGFNFLFTDVISLL